MERFFDGTDQENSEKQEGKNGGKKKKILFCNGRGGSHTRVFSICWERPRVTLPQDQEEPLEWEPPLQNNACSPGCFVF